MQYNINFSASFQPHRISPERGKKKCFVSNPRPKSTSQQHPEHPAIRWINNRKCGGFPISVSTPKNERTHHGKPGFLFSRKTWDGRLMFWKKCGVELEAGEDPLVPVSQFHPPCPPHCDVYKRFPDKQLCFIAVIFQSVTILSGG